MSLSIWLHLEVDGGGPKTLGMTVHECNITHNLGKMANEAGIYQVLWRPEECGVKVAGDMIEALEKGLEDMKVRPAHYRQFDAKNGWGTYDDFIPFLDELLTACKRAPKAEISISR